MLAMELNPLSLHTIQKIALYIINKNGTQRNETERNEIKRTKLGKIVDIFRPEKEKCSMKT
jgi:hypothetical protein